MKKLLWFLFTLPIMLLPIEIFIAFWLFLKPTTFWQRLVTIILGSIFLSVIQTILFIAWLTFLAALFDQINQDKRKRQNIKEQSAFKKKNRIEQYL